MKSFIYTIKDANGIHGRPAGNLVKLAKKFKSNITISCNGRSSDLTKLMAVMSMGVGCGSEVEVAAEGADEEIAANSIEEYFKQHM